MSDEGYELDYVREAFDTNWVAPLGKNVDCFETELCEKIGAKFGAALCSGTAALHLALLAAGVGEGDIVFCPTLTFSATANPIIYVGATPVFIDCDENWSISLEALGKAFKKYPQVKAVMTVHLYGLASNLEELSAMCKAHGVPLIEDAAESLGTQYNGKFTGTFGDFAAFSFNGNKIITSSGGGMLVSNIADEKIAEERIKKVRFWSTQSRDPARHYQHSELGFNYRMSNIVAGIGRGQLKVLDERVAQKNAIHKYYVDTLSGLDGVSMMPVDSRCKPNFWLSCITLSGKVQPLDVILALEKENIESRPIWKPMHLQPFFERYDYIGGTAAQSVFESGVCLPSDTKLTDSELAVITDTIKSLF